MKTAEYITLEPPLRDRLWRQARIVRVLSRTDFKLKYAGSLLGYVWSVMKPLLYFGVLWVVFQSIFRSEIRHFPLYLIIGLVLWTFVADAVAATLPSIVARGSILRRISFPPIVIPLASTVTALMSFAVNLLVVVVFVAFAGIKPSPSWILLLPLFLELYLFVLGLTLIAATLYVRFRDVAQIWEVATPMLFFTAPIVYPVRILPDWALPLLAFNPFVQIMQDTRQVIIGSDENTDVPLLGGPADHLVPLAVTAFLCLTSFWLYRREAPRLAELT